MSDWISIKDKLPEKYQRVLATNGDEIEIAEFRGYPYGDAYTNIDSQTWYIGWFGGDDGGIFNSKPYSYQKYLKKVTHWMPLPEMPNDS